MYPISYVLLIIIVISSFKFFKKSCKAIFIMGFTFPMIMKGLYGLYFIPYIGIIFVIFLPLTIIFNKPAWWLLIEKISLINGMNLSLINKLELDILNGLFWGIIFLIICLSKTHLLK